MVAMLEIRGLHAGIEGREILRGVDLTVRQGEIHALMGPNGTGKSTLANVLMGHPSYQVTQGEVLFQGANLVDLAPDERARLGLFLAFQYPVAIPGLSVANFLRSAINAKRRVADPDDKGISVPEFRKLLKEKMDLLQMPHEFAGRYLNDGFSGGEKKRAEILQLATLEPKDRRPGRDRFGSRHRRAAHRRRRGQRAGRRVAGRAADHPLPAHSELHQAASRAHHARRPNRPVGRRRPGRAP